MKKNSKDQPVTDELDTYTEEQLYGVLDEMVESQSLPIDTVDNLRKLPKDSLIGILRNHLANKGSVLDTPDQYIQAAIRRPYKEIGKLRIALNTKPVGFVVEFANKSGLDVIKDQLWNPVIYFILENDYYENLIEDHPFLYYKTKVEREKCDKLSYEACQCVKPLIKMQDILKKIIADDVLLTLFCLYTSYGSYLTRKIACETLTVILYYDSSLVGRILQCFSTANQLRDVVIRNHFMHPHENHTNITQVVSDFKLSDNPFELWMNAFDKVLLGRGILGSKVQSNLLENMSEDQLNDFALSNWILINGFLRVPPSIPLRIHIRNLMLQSRLDKILDTCTRMNNELIGWQLRQYREDEKLDNKWLSDVNQLKMQDFQDPAECLDYLLRQTSQTPSAYFYLTKTMQLLTLIRDDPDNNFNVRHLYLRLISDIVEKIVLDNNGIDPSFTDLYGISIKSIIQGMQNDDVIESLRNQLKDTQIKLNIAQKQQVKQVIDVPEAKMDNLHYIQQIDHLKDLLQLSQNNTQLLQEQIKEESDKYRNVLLNHDKHLEKLLKAIKENSDLSQLDQMKEMLNQDFNQNFPAPTASDVQLDSIKAENARLRDQLKILKHRQTAIAPLALQERPASPTSHTTSKSLKSKLRPITPIQPVESKPIEAPVSPSGPPPTSGGPPPPPPPPMSAPILKKYRPKSQLKQLNWDKLPEHQTRDTIFHTLNIIEDDLHQQKVFDEMEEMFGTKQGMSRSGSDTNLSDSGGHIFVNQSTPIEKEGETSVLDVKKAYNVNIMLGKIRHITPFEIKQAVLEINKSILNPLFIQQLNKFMPNSKEIGKLQAYKHKKSNLSKADLFFMEMLSIPRFQRRLELIEFTYDYDEMKEDVELFITKLNKACVELKNSTSFKKILEMVLALGNFMNNGYRGGAAGFKITSINKLSDTKSYDNSTTLLHFLVKIIKQKFPEALSFTSEFASVHEACRIDLHHSRQELIKLKKGLEDVNDEIDILGLDSDFEIYKKKMSEFYDIRFSEINQLNTAFRQAEKAFKEVCKLFGEQSSKQTCEEFFGIFSSFKSSFEVF